MYILLIYLYRYSGWKTDDRHVNPGPVKIVFDLCRPLQLYYCEKLHTSSSVYSKQEQAEPEPKLIGVGCSDPLTSNQAVLMFGAYAPQKKNVGVLCLAFKSDHIRNAFMAGLFP